VGFRAESYCAADVAVVVVVVVVMAVTQQKKTDRRVKAQYRRAR